MSFFTQKSIGLDIADQTVEVVELEKTSLGGVKINGLGRILLEPGIVDKGKILEAGKLRVALARLFAASKPTAIIPKKIVFGLPDSQIYTHIFRIPSAQINDKDELVLTEALNVIPLEEEDLLYSYKIVSADKEQTEILLVATSRQLVADWQDFFLKIGIEVEIFDLESLAVLRGLFINLSKPVAIVDIGSATTNIYIFGRHGLNYSHSLKIAGDYFTKKIMADLKLNLLEAEAQKIKFGLGYPKSKTYPILTALLSDLASEIKVALTYFEEKYSEKISGVIFIGGSSQMFGLVDYFKKILARPCVLGEAKLVKNKIPLEYVEAVGLALRTLDSAHATDPQIKPQASEISSLPIKEVVVESKPQIEEASLQVATYSGDEPIGNPTDQDLATALGAPEAKEKKIRSKLLLLLDILIIGAVLVGAATQYRNYQRAKRAEEIQKSIVQYNQLQNFDFKVTVAINNLEYNAGRVSGRLVRNVVNEGLDYDSARLESLNLAKNELSSGEKIYEQPLDEISLKNSRTFPMNFSWLVYSEKSFLDYLQKEIDRLNVNKTAYAINSIETNSLEQTGNVNIFYLYVKISVYVNELISGQ